MPVANRPGVSMMPSTVVENSGTLFTLTRSDFADIRKRKEKENPGRIAQITAACFLFQIGGFGTGSLCRN